MATVMCALNPTIFSARRCSNPAMTDKTTISVPTPSVTPRNEKTVMTETKVRRGRRYRNARKSSTGRRIAAR